MSYFLYENHWGSSTLTSLNVLGVRMLHCDPAESNYSDLTGFESGSCYPTQSLSYWTYQSHTRFGCANDMHLAHMASKAISRYFSLSFYGPTDGGHNTTNVIHTSFLMENLSISSALMLDLGA